MVTGRSDDSGCGILTEVQLRTVQGSIHILGTYWPSKPGSKYIKADAGNLWSRVTTFLQSRHNSRSPIHYVQHLAHSWTQTAASNGAQAIILAGDLNATVSSTERGGQRQPHR